MARDLTTVLEPSEWRQSQSSSPWTGLAGSIEQERRAVLLLAVLALLWGLWEGYRALGIHYGWTQPVPRRRHDDAAHPRDGRTRSSSTRTRRRRCSSYAPEGTRRFHREGGRRSASRWARPVGFVLGALLAHSRMLQRGLLPYVVASQTVPILAIAPMVVIWLGLECT